MSNLLDIHASLPYSAIAKYIGLEAFEGQNSSGKCPFCGEFTWTIQQDSINLEETHYCYNCKKAGTVLELASQRLRLNPVSTIKYLHEKLNFQLNKDTLTLFVKNQNNQRRLDKLHIATRRKMLKPDLSEQKILTKIGIMPDAMSNERLLEGPAALYGVMNCKELRTHMKVNARVKNNAFVMVPCYKNTKQISYFLYLTEDNEISPGRQNSISDIAFSGLQFMPKFQTQYVIVTSMVRNSLKLQHGNFQTSNVPLPILAWKPALISVPKIQWTILDGFMPVFWERYPTPLMLHQAMMADARISFVGPSRLTADVKATPKEDWDKWIKYESAIDNVRKIESNSLPYEQALVNWLRRASVAEKIQLITEADKFSAEVSKLVRRSIGPDFKGSAPRRVNVPTLAKGGKLGTHGYVVVVEKEGKWYNFSGQLKLPGIVRVDYVVVRPNNKREYIGKLITAKKEIPFRTTLKEASLLWFKDLGEKNGVSMLVPSEHSIFKHKTTDNFNPIDAACRFNEPKMVVGLERIGWDKEGFQFSRTKILKGKFNEIPEFTFLPETPGPDKTTYDLNLVEEDLSKSGPEMEIVWGFSLALCAQLTAAAASRIPYGILIARKEYDAFLYQLTEKMHISKNPEGKWEHNWPRVFDCLNKARRNATDNYFVTVGNTSKADELVKVQADDEDLSPRLVSAGVGSIVPLYLQHFTAMEKIPYRKHYQKWLEFTCEEFLKVFKTTPPEVIQKGYLRLTASTNQDL
jgi:hypothetical protein